MKLVKMLNYLLFSAVLPCECRITRTILLLHRGLVRQPHFVTFAAFPLVKAVYLLKS